MCNMYNALNVIFTSFLTVDDLNTELVHTLFSLLLFALQEIKVCFYYFYDLRPFKMFIKLHCKMFTPCGYYIILLLFIYDKTPDSASHFPSSGCSIRADYVPVSMVTVQHQHHRCHLHKLSFLPLYHQPPADGILQAWQPRYLVWPVINTRSTPVQNVTCSSCRCVQSRV